MSQVAGTGRTLRPVTSGLGDLILFPYLQAVEPCTPANLVISGSKEPNVRRCAR
jgi:hypothetical protein